MVKTHFDDFTAIVKGTFNKHKLILPILTAIGAWGGFPKGPKSFHKLTESKLFQYFFLWILIFQGGSEAEFDVSVIAVFLVYCITELVVYLENNYFQITEKFTQKSINGHPILYQEI